MKRKVLVVVDGVGPPAARGTDSIYLTHREMSRLGVEVHMLTLIDFLTPGQWQTWMDKQSKEGDLFFHAVHHPVIRSSSRLGTPFSRACYFFKTLALMKNQGFDLIHEYSTAPLLFYRTALYKAFFKVKCVHSLSGYHTGFLGNLRWNGGMKRLDKIVCLSQDLKARLEDLSGEPEKLAYVSYGADLTRFTKNGKGLSLRDQYGIKPEEKVVLYVGPVEEHKGIFELAQAAARLTPRFGHVWFFFVGRRRRPEKEHRKNQARLRSLLNGVPRMIIEEGMHDIPRFMTMADLVVVPQKTCHGIAAQPVTLLEAMKCGKPVIGSSTPGIRELIHEGKNGFLFKPGSSEELAEILEKLLNHPDLFQGLNRGAASINMSAYDVRTSAKKLLQIYENLWRE